MSAEGALMFLMQVTLDLAKDYIDTKSGAGFQFSELQKDLALLAAHLRDAADMKWKDHTLVEKEKQVRKLVYQVEDVIDMCLAEKAAAKTKGIFRKIPRIVGTGTAVTVKNLRANQVAHALNLLKPLESGNKGDPAKLKQGNSDSSNNKILDVESSYRDLAHHQRVCLLYTALFPEEYIFASTLTELWIAERFILQKDNETLEETATQLLNDLIKKNLLVAHEKRLDQVKICRVEDKTREFCKQKAIEENLFTVIESDNYADRSLYRLSFHSDPTKFLSETKKAPNNVRSFLCLDKVQNPINHPINLHPECSSTIPDVFKPLRILKCESTKFEKLPKKLTSLKLLKHITMRIDKLEALPKELSKLSYLQTLIIKTQFTPTSITVKANIWRMEQLRHLKSKTILDLDDGKWKAGKATNLQTISRLSSKSCTEDLSKKAPNLKSLGIQGNVEAEFLEKLGLENFEHLEKLKLVHYKKYGILVDMKRFPPRERFPRTLNSLTLSNTNLIWGRDMENVAKISTLKVLKLKDNAFKGASWTADSYKFPNLKLLLIKDTDLVTWGLTTREFPLLDCIVIKNCKNLKSVPDSLAKKVKSSKTDASSSSI